MNKKANRLNSFSKCNCDLCKRGRKFDRVIIKLKTMVPYEKYVWIEKDIKWLEDLYNHLIEVETELDVINNIDSDGWEGFYGTVENRIIVDETITDPDAWICIIGPKKEDAKLNNS